MGNWFCEISVALCAAEIELTPATSGCGYVPYTHGMGKGETCLCVYVCARVHAGLFFFLIPDAVGLELTVYVVCLNVLKSVNLLMLSGSLLCLLKASDG